MSSGMAVASELHLLRSELAAVREREAFLVDELEQIRARAADLEARAGLRRSDAGPRGPRPVNGPTLRGRAIREAAVRLIAASDRAGEVMHHSEWYAMFCDAGYAVAGRAPENSFLVQLGRSPVVRRGDHPGTYYLDLEWPARAERHLASLRAEFADWTRGVEFDPVGLEEERKQRARMLADIDRLGRSLTEALRSLPEAQTQKRVAA